MSDVIVHHVGGGGGSAYAFVIVNYPAGSTVTCTNFSGKKDLSATQKLFYIKKGATSCVVTATLGSQSTSATVTGITEGSSKTITLSYAVPMFGLEHQSWAEISANMQQISLDGVYRQFNNTDPSLQLFSKDANQISYGIIWRTAIPTGKKYLKIRYTKTGNDNTIGLSSSVSAISSLVSAAVPASENEAIVSLPIQGVSDPSYMYIQGPSGGSDLRIIEVFVS